MGCFQAGKNALFKLKITHFKGVYDITEFVSLHPGGDKILMAAGSSIVSLFIIFGIIFLFFYIWFFKY